MKKYLLAIGLLLAALSSPPNAQATLISADDPQFGPGSFTIDTATGLGWLDVPLTFNKSMDSIKADSGLGGTYYGLRYATMEDVVTLYADAGLDRVLTSGNLSVLNTASNPSETGYYVDTLKKLLGGSTDVLYGMTGTGPDQYGLYVGSELASYIGGFGLLIGEAYTSTFVDGTAFLSDVPRSYAGSFLVRDQSPVPTPEPSTFLLLGAGLAGIGFMRRRVKL